MKGSNREWAHPHDPEARITKMKDGRTGLAHKFEQAVDMETGAVVAVTVQTMEGGDTASLEHAGRGAAATGGDRGGAEGSGGRQGLPLEPDDDGCAPRAAELERAQPRPPEVEAEPGRAEADL